MPAAVEVEAVSLYFLPVVSSCWDIRYDTLTLSSKWNLTSEVKSEMPT